MRLRNWSLTSVLVLTVSFVAVGCTGPSGSSTYTVSTGGNVSHPLKHDWSPGIPIEQGVVNSCYFTPSDGQTHNSLCRVVDGYEESGDRRNWTIDFPASPPSHPLSVSGVNGSTLGMMIVLDDGAMFEGCDWYSPSNDYVCDYRVRKPVAVRISGGGYDYLTKLWDWSRYVAGGPLSCATGIASVWTGAKITAPLLGSCLSDPMKP